MKPHVAMVFLAAWAQPAFAEPPVDLSRFPGLVDAAAKIPSLQVDLKYATSDNFLRRNVYGDIRTCYLVDDAATMLARAQGALASSHPELRLRAYDCARPHRVQLEMWTIVRHTKQRPYVADPTSKLGSMHNYGCAIDLTLARADGTPLDMGTPFDHFGEAAHPAKEAMLLLAGKLTADQVANRLLLRETMVRAGFLPLDHEWWHFNCASPKVALRKYVRVP
jgi:D-alanyl-D-alanine dipeptidase